MDYCVQSTLYSYSKLISYWYDSYWIPWIFLSWCSSLLYFKIKHLQTLPHVLELFECSAEQYESVVIKASAGFICSLLPDCFSLFWFLFSFFLSFILSGCKGIFFFFFFCPFWCLKSSASVQEELCENCSICSCILDVLMRRDEFHILLFCHFDCDLCQCSVYAFL